MNDNKNKIIREEFARAIMIKKANSVLSESAFRGFISEMKKYEQNMVITENMSSESIYDGFQKQLHEQTAEVGKEGEIIANQYGEGEGKVTADAEKKPPTGGTGADGDKGDKDSKKSGSDPKKFPQTLTNAGQIELKRLNMTDPVKMAQYVMNNTDRFDTRDQIEAEQYIRFQKEKLGGGEAPAEPTGDVKKDTQNLGKELESPKAKGILSSIFDSYKFAFAANASMWEKIYGFIAGIGDKPPAQQAQAAQQAADNLEDSVPSDQEAGRSAEDPDGDEEGADSGEKKPIRVRSIQRPIINAVQRVAAAQGIDMSIKQAQEISIAITKNLADQMRANGTMFKGDKPKEKTDVVSESVLKDGSSARKLFFEHLNMIINEERLAGKYGLKKKFKSKDKAKLPKNYKYGAVGAQDWVKTYKAVKMKYKQMNLSNKESHEELKNTDNADNYVDYYDMYLDLVALRQLGGGTLLTVKRKIKKLEKEEEKNDSMLTSLENIEGDLLDGREDVKTMIKRYTLHGDVTRPGIGKEMKKKYIKLKKQMKGMGKKDKVGAKDMSMSKPQKGKVNISQTVSKAIQAGGLDRDVAKKIAPILKNKIEKIIAKHVDSDVKYLEEKINRYVNSVIKEIK